MNREIRAKVWKSRPPPKQKKSLPTACMLGFIVSSFFLFIEILGNPELYYN
jgi:hypothetical protein